MSMLRECAALGCRTRTLGEFCLAHESPATTSVRGRVSRAGGEPGESWAAADPRMGAAIRHPSSSLTRSTLETL
jgi:hypothetical protein